MDTVAFGAKKISFRASFEIRGCLQGYSVSEREQPRRRILAVHPWKINSVSHPDGATSKQFEWKAREKPYQKMVALMFA